MDTILCNNCWMIQALYMDVMSLVYQTEFSFQLSDTCSVVVRKLRIALNSLPDYCIGRH